MRKIKLASKSPRRQEILKRENIDFDIVDSPWEEKIDNKFSPEINAMVNGWKKARAAWENGIRGTILGCDTIVHIDGEILGKPKNKEDAERMLKLLSDKKHQVISGFGIIDSQKKINKCDFTITDVYVKKLEKKELERLLEKEEYEGKAGAYMIQGAMGEYIEKIEGSYDSVVGLPIEDIKPYIGIVEDERENYGIRDMPEERRPRERAMANGVESVTDSELLSIIIGTGATTKEKKYSALDLADEVLKKYKSLKNLNNISMEELTSIDGIGKVKAIKLMVALELGIRARLGVNDKKIQLNDPRKVVNFFKKDLAYIKKEEVWIGILDTKCNLIDKVQISVGTINQSLIHPREIFEPAIRKMARGVIIVHNHPSGNPHPSHEDKMVTKRLFEAGEILGIDVLDHLIIAGENYYSFKEEGIL